jgi:sec-independent protein translocase protein TatC
MTDALPSGDDEFGARKSFWDHLRDLRTALVRSFTAIGLAMIVCLLISPKIMPILEYPLQNIDKFQTPKPTVAFKIGDTQLGPYEVSLEKMESLGGVEGGLTQLRYELGVDEIDGKKVATLTPLPVDPAASSLRVRLLNLTPAEAFFIAFRVAFYAAMVVAAPFWIYFMGQFFLPALSVREKSVIYQWLGWGVLLFFSGVLLTYFILLPLALRASVEYSHLLGFEAYDWRADAYIGFVTKFIVGMGIGFQFPIIVLLLVKMGFLTADQLAHYRRHVVVLSLVLGALLTTPEVITQVAMAIPLYILYEISILIARHWERKARRAAAT